MREEKVIASKNVNRTINKPFAAPQKSFASCFYTNSKEKPSIIKEFLNLANYFLEPEEMNQRKSLHFYIASRIWRKQKQRQNFYEF